MLTKQTAIKNEKTLSTYHTVFFIGLFFAKRTISAVLLRKGDFEKAKISYEELLKEILRTHSIF
jgi:hypothetical protein